VHAPLRARPASRARARVAPFSSASWCCQDCRA
jgi:hypothetical protein